MKKALALFLASSMAVAMVGCSQPAEPAADGDAAASPAPGQTWEVSLSTPQPEGPPMSTQTQWFADTVYERTDGAVKINIFYFNALGPQKDMFSALANNELELYMGGTESVSYYAEEYGFLTAPYLIRDGDHMLALMDSPVWTDFEAKLAENNINMIGECIRASRVTYSKVELNSTDDISNLIIRMPDLTSYIDAWTELGASVQVIGGGEVYSGLSTGVINSCEGPYEQGLSDKYNEVTTYLYPTNHVTEFGGIYASQDWLDSLPADIAEIVMTTAAEAFDQATVDNLALVETNRQALIDGGMTYVDTVDFNGLFEVLRPTYEENFNNGTWVSSYDDVMAAAG